MDENAIEYSTPSPLPADWHLIEREGRSDLERVYRGQFEDGRETGVWHQWYGHGRKMSDRHYLMDGDLVVHVVWHPGGPLRSVYQYWRNERHGTEIYWEESGKLSSIRVFDRGTVVYGGVDPHPGSGPR